VSGGTPPYSFFQSGSVPGGLSLDGSTGIVSGTPTTKGVFVFTILVADAVDASAQVECSIRIIGKCLVPPDVPTVPIPVPVGNVGFAGSGGP